MAKRCCTCMGYDIGSPCIAGPVHVWEEMDDSIDKPKAVTEAAPMTSLDDVPFDRAFEPEQIAKMLRTPSKPKRVHQYEESLITERVPYEGEFVEGRPATPMTETKPRPTQDDRPMTDAEILRECREQCRKAAQFDRPYNPSYPWTVAPTPPVAKK